MVQGRSIGLLEKAALQFAAALYLQLLIHMRTARFRSLIGNDQIPLHDEIELEMIL